MYVSRSDNVVVLVCGTSLMTGSCCGFSRRDVYVSALTHGVSLTTVISDLLEKHCDVVLPHCRTVRSTLGVTARFPDSSLREHGWLPQASTPSSDTTSSHHRPGSHHLKLPALLIPGCAAMPVAAPLSARTLSGMIGLSDRLSSMRRNTAVRLNFYAARQLCTPS